MSLSDLAALGSFISGVAVLISFVFLAFQMRQNAHNQRATVHNERTALTQDLTLALAGDKETSEIWHRGNAADPSLDITDTNRYYMIMLSIFWAYEEHFYQHRDGMIDESRWATTIRRLRSMSVAPGCRAAWRVASVRMFESDFADWVNKIMDETPAVSGSAVLANAWKEATRLELAAAAKH